MNITKLAPWNWFKDEDDLPASTLPVRRIADAEPWVRPFEEFRREMDRMFDDFFRGFGLAPWRRGLLSGPAWAEDQWLKPSVEISSTDREYTINVELPGVSEKDVQIELAGDTLRIRGEKKQEKEDKGRNYYSVERAYGSFQRVLTLPEDARREGIAATFKIGVLTISIPRQLIPQAEVKRIEVKAA